MLRDDGVVNVEECQHTRFPPGTKKNPLETKAVNAKARVLMAPVLGAKRTEAVILQFNQLDQVGDVGKLIRAVLTV